MLRRAVIQHLAAQVHSLGGRVYQAFLAPSNADRPYATVKMATQRGSVAVSFAAHQPVEVRVYNNPSSFAPIDQIAAEVIRALHGVEMVDAQTGSRYRLEWRPGGGDFQDPEMNLIGRLVLFEAATLHEPR